MCVCVCVCVFVCVCVGVCVGGWVGACVNTSIHRKGFICLDQLDGQGKDQCYVEGVFFLCQVPSSLLYNEARNLSN